MSEYETIVILDNVEYPSNIGSIIRSSVLLGIKTIIVIGDLSNKKKKDVSRYSMNNDKDINVVYVKKVEDISINLDYFKFVAIETDGDEFTTDTDVFEIDYVAYIFGNERKGIINTFDVYKTITIPTLSNKCSYNVGTTAGIILYKRFEALYSR